LRPKGRPEVYWFGPVSLPSGEGAFRGGAPWSKMRSIFPLRVLISSLSCVIQTMLKVDMALAAIEMPMEMNHLGLPGVEISIL